MRHLRWIVVSLLLLAGSNAWGHDAKLQAELLDEVLRLTHAEVPDQIVLEQIDAWGFVFELTADDIVELRTLGVSDAIIRALIQTAGWEEIEPVVSRPRVYVGAGFYSPWYHFPYAWAGYCDHPEPLFGYALAVEHALVVSPSHSVEDKHRRSFSNDRSLNFSVRGIDQDAVFFKMFDRFVFLIQKPADSPSGYPCPDSRCKQSVRSLRHLLPVIFSNGVEGVDDPAGGDRFSTVGDIRWKDEDFSGGEMVAGPIDDQFEFAFDHIHNLFVGVGVFGQGRPFFELPIGQGHVVRMDETNMQPRQEFFLIDLIEIDNWHFASSEKRPDRI